jgi:hypothetical protein
VVVGVQIIDHHVETYAAPKVKDALMDNAVIIIMFVETHAAQQDKHVLVDNAVTVMFVGVSAIIFHVLAVG